MNLMNRFFTILFAFSFLAFHSLLAQSFSIGSWREHLPYLQGKVVAISPSRVFCATQDGLFSYEKGDNSLNRFSKLNGLNDFGISSIVYSETYHELIIAYNNTNIDLLNDENKILVEEAREAIWNLYQKLKEYKLNPTQILNIKDIINNEFDNRVVQY